MNVGSSQVGPVSCSETGREDIAIVGMSCIVPGADTLARYWQNIVDGVDCISDPPPERSAEWECFGNASASEPVYTSRGGFLGDLCRFDPLKYGVLPASVDGGEPDQYLALRCAYEALADAGVPELPFNRERTAVILGRGAFINRGLLTWITHGMVIDQVLDLLRQIMPGRTDTELLKLRDELKRNLPPFSQESMPGLAHSVLVGRIANRLNLMGSAYTLDAACSSSLIAVEHGMRELRAGRCDAVLAGGVQVSTPALIYQTFCKISALSQTGRIAPFSAESNGTLLGEGCGILVLKRRSDAERDGNRIYAVVKSVGVSSDGKGAGLLAPRTDGQQLAMRRAYEQADILPASIAVVEAHGTGIPLGDQTEIGSLKAHFGPRLGEMPTIALGSVKSMIGHLIPASGAASMIKLALSLYQKVVPPTLHAESPNPGLALEGSPFYLSTRPRPWIHGSLKTPRRAAVDAFGFGGINAHAILEEHPASDDSPSGRLLEDWPVELVVVSASDRAALADRVGSLAQWLEKAEGVRLLDVGAACAEESGACRIALVARDVGDLRKKLRRSAELLQQEDRQKIQDRAGVFWFADLEADRGRTAFVFPGEGCQYPNMLADLCLHFPEVRREFDLTDSALIHSEVAEPLGSSIFPPPGVTKDEENDLTELEGAVVTVTTASRALLALAGRLGLKPDAVVGHSSGEYGSLLAAGVYSLSNDERSLRLIAGGVRNAVALGRSGLVPETVLTTIGGADREAVDRVIADSDGKLVVVVDNCPNQIVIAGDEETTAWALQALQGKGGLCRRLPWGRAYHTESFTPGCEIIKQYYSELGIGSPKLEVWSCATAMPYPQSPDAVFELAIRQWRSPVRFRETILAMYEAGMRTFVEVGPRGNLSAFIADTLGKRPHAAIPLDLPRVNGIEQLCRAVGMLAARGVPLKVSELYRQRNPKRLDLTSATVPKAVREPLLSQVQPRLAVSDDLANAWKTQAEEVRPSPTIPSTPRFAFDFADKLQHRDPAPAANRLASVRESSDRLSSNGLRPSVEDRADSSRRERGARVMSRYQRTMRMFLETQERVGLLRFAAPVSHSGDRNGNGNGVKTASPYHNGTTNHAKPSPTITVPRRETPVPPKVSPKATPPSPSAKPPQNGETTAPAPITVVPERSTPALQTPADDLASLLLRVVSDRTGYPVDMLDFESNLEADLGIDSIKRVEIVSAYRRLALPGIVHLPAGYPERLAESRTLGAILELVRELAGKPRENAVSASAAIVDEPPARHPYIETILAHESGQRLVAECELETSRHPFLLDHTFFGKLVSVNDQALTSMPVMPLAMTIEIMAEAASALFPGRAVVALRNFKPHRWLAFETSSRRLRLEAIATKPDQVHVTAFEADREGMSAVVAEADVELGPGRNDLGAPVVPDTGITPFPRPQTEIYEWMLINGPSLQGIVEIEAFDPQGVRATLKQPDPALLLPSDRKGNLALPVSLIDLAGQLIGIQALHAIDQDVLRVIYPGHFDTMEIGPLPNRGELLKGVAAVRMDDDRVTCGVEILGEKGQVVLRIAGWQHERVPLPTRFYKSWSRPKAVTLSHSIDDLFHGLPHHGRFKINEIGSSDWKFLGQRFWSKVLSRMTLSRKELAVFEAIKLPPIPATSWLLGRAAAKDAVRSLGKLDLCMGDVSLLSNPEGRPIAWIGEKAGPLVSLAHKSLLAVAVAADPGTFLGVGIDVEPCLPMDEGVIADAFDDAERALIETAFAASDEPRERWYLGAWGAKEAVGKATGRGVVGGPKSLRIEAIDVATGRILVSPQGAMAEVVVEFAKGVPLSIPIPTYSRCKDGKVVTLCLLPRPPE